MFFNLIVVTCVCSGDRIVPPDCLQELTDAANNSANFRTDSVLHMLYMLVQEVEELERAEKTGDQVAVKAGKLGKVGKVKSKKAMVDTQPSPMGRRIQPRIDSAMKMKAEKAEAAKKTKLAKVESLFDFIREKRHAS